MWLGLAAVLPGNIGSSKLMYPVIFWIIFSGSQPLWQNDTTIILQHMACTYTSVDFHPLLPIPSPNWCASPSTTTTAAVFHEGTYLCMHSSHRTGLGLNCSLVRLILKADSQAQMWETSIPMTTPLVCPYALWSPTSVPYPFYWFFSSLFPPLCSKGCSGTPASHAELGAAPCHTGVMACPSDPGLSKMKKPSAVGWEVLGKKGHADRQPQSC